MSSREKQQERNFLIECIKLYKRLPVLWNLKHKEYHNRDKKNYQYEVLLRKYRERYRSANKADLLKRINSLRTNYRKEWKRINEALQKDNKNVQPTLWYYKEMQFLTNEDNETDNEDEEEIVLPIKTQSPKKPQNKLQETRGLKHISSPQPKLRKLLPKTNNLSKTEPSGKVYASNDFISTTAKSIAPLQNEYEKVAAFWSVELQKMDARQQLYAKKSINDILFEGQLGNLHKNSVEINRIGRDDDATAASYIKNNYEPSIIYKGNRPNNSNDTKYEIEQDDPIEHDTILNTTITPELIIEEEEEEEEEMEDMEILNDEHEDIQHLLENPIYTDDEEEDEEIEHDTNDTNQSNEVLLESQIYTFSDWQKDQENYKKQPKDKRAMCSYCSKILYDKHSLIQHEETHKEHRERKFICQHCGLKMFSQKSLYGHLQTHKENREKKIQCEYCDKTYYNRSALNIHQRIHLGQMLQCSMCPKEYFRKIDLNRHMRTHSTIPLNNVMKKYKYLINCKDCGKKITTKRWRSHKAFHMNKPLVKCSICNKDFFSKSSCYRHVRLIHHVPRENYGDVIIQCEEKFERQSFLMLKQNEIIETIEME